jgi:hypothetical protein
MKLGIIFISTGVMGYCKEHDAFERSVAQPSGKYTNRASKG